MRPLNKAVMPFMMMFSAGIIMTPFVRQLILSRDKMQYDMAQQRALDRVSNELRQMRVAAEQNIKMQREINMHLIGVNNDEIHRIQSDIQGFQEKKLSLISSYEKMGMTECPSVINGLLSTPCKKISELLREEVAKELEFNDNEIKLRQSRRAAIWTHNSDALAKLNATETARNDELSKLYEQQTKVLTEIHLSHTKNSEHVAIETIDAGNQSIKQMVASLQLLVIYFKSSFGISIERSEQEKRNRQTVMEVQRELADLKEEPPIHKLEPEAPPSSRHPS